MIRFILLSTAVLCMARVAVCTDLPAESRQLPTTGLDPVADPTCARGTRGGGAVCCTAGCSPCGGPVCKRQPLGAQCCGGAISNSGRLCSSVGPPCIVGGGSPPSPTPSKSAAPASIPTAGDAVWKNIDASIMGMPRARHEACFVMVRGKGYLFGGRGFKGLDIFDPITRVWSRGTDPPMQMHHMQCVAYRASIFVVSSWFGPFPNEENNARMYIYNTREDKWYSRRGLPEPRRRGGAASVLYDNKIYVVGGNRGGHGDGSISLGYMDYYDLVTKTWVMGLPELPEPRDHVGGAIVKGKLCIAGGRLGSAKNFFAAVVKSTYCFDFAMNKWENMNAEIPAGRAGAATGTSCDGRMMIAGGEGRFQAAFNRVDFFDGTSWSTGPSLKRARHGTGLAISQCNRCNHIFIASGSGARGGRPELSSTEIFFPDGMGSQCTKF